MKKLLRAFSILLCLTLTFAGCNGSVSNKETEGSVELAGNGKIYPLKTEESISWWLNFSGYAGTVYNNMSETPFGQALVKQTGVNIEFIHPTASNLTEQFNLLIASGNVPDIMSMDWYGVSGGPEFYLKNNTIISLNDVIDKYAPSLKAYLQDNPDIDKQIKTDSGNYYVFPFIRGDELLTVSSGPILRMDLLKKYGQSVPETIDDWEAMLRTMKNNGVSKPLCYDFMQYSKLGAFIGAYGEKLDFYVEDGQVKYGPAENGTKEWLKRMNQWYAEGLLDNNIVSLSTSVLEQNILGGTTCASMGYPGSTIGKYMDAMKEKNADFEIVGAPYPVLAKGETPKFGQKDNRYVPLNSAAITSKCKNVELAARVLDYGYSEEGSLLFNFGVEGESFEMIDGYPKYTDVILNNSEGLSIANALTLYTNVVSSSFVQDKRYLEQYYVYPQQTEAVTTWSNTDSGKYLLPMITFNSEETSTVANLLTEINTYMEEMIFKFVEGSEPIDNFETYQKELDALGLQEVLEIYNDALQRYNER